MPPCPICGQQTCEHIKMENPNRFVSILEPTLEGEPSSQPPPSQPPSQSQRQNANLAAEQEAIARLNARVAEMQKREREQSAPPSQAPEKKPKGQPTSATIPQPPPREKKVEEPKMKQEAESERKAVTVVPRPTTTGSQEDLEILVEKTVQDRMSDKAKGIQKIVKKVAERLLPGLVDAEMNRKKKIVKKYIPEYFPVVQIPEEHHPPMFYPDLVRKEIRKIANAMIANLKGGEKASVFSRADRIYITWGLYDFICFRAEPSIGISYSICHNLEHMHDEMITTDITLLPALDDRLKEGVRRALLFFFFDTTADPWNQKPADQQIQEQVDEKKRLKGMDR